MSRESVETLLSRSFRKLGVRTRAAAVSAAHERGFPQLARVSRRSRTHAAPVSSDRRRCEDAADDGH